MPRAFVPLGVRILAINVLALAILLGGFLYLDRYQQDLFGAKISGLAIEGGLIAAALEADVQEGTEDELAGVVLIDPVEFLRRLDLPSERRVRLYDSFGRLVVDSDRLPGQTVRTTVLPPPEQTSLIGRAAIAIYDWIVRDWPPRRDFPPITEARDDPAAQEIVQAALRGETRSLIGEIPDRTQIALVARPLQPLKRVQGALIISASAEDVARSVREVRFAVLEAFGIALAITVLLSLYLAGTITRPVRRLAKAAARAAKGGAQKPEIPDFTTRRDEIGSLSAALREMTSALWHRIDAIERFTADVAHEIKNPLSSLRSAVDTAQRIEDPEKRRRLLDIVRQDVGRLDRLLSEISAASRLDTELARLKLERVDLNTLLSSIVAFDAQAHADTPSTPRLILTASGQGPFLVEVDQDRLLQVVQNLLNNARSFSPPGVTIRIGLKRQGNKVCFEVEDEGPGVPEAIREAIFERFYSLRPAGEKFGTHSGLGLSISRQITEAFGGTIHCVAGNSGKGARFIVNLPAT